MEKSFIHGAGWSSAEGRDEIRRLLARPGDIMIEGALVSRDALERFLEIPKTTWINYPRDIEGLLKNAASAFGDLRIVPVVRKLSRKSGYIRDVRHIVVGEERDKEFPLSPVCYDLLGALVGLAGAILTKPDAFWVVSRRMRELNPDTKVVNIRISQLRKFLRDEKVNSRVEIVTVHGLGWYLSDPIK